MRVYTIDEDENVILTDDKNYLWAYPKSEIVSTFKVRNQEYYKLELTNHNNTLETLSMVLSFQRLYARYPFLGQIVGWHGKGGYGYIRLYGTRKRFFAHFSDRQPLKTPPQADPTGKLCVFHVGYSPKKQDDRPLAINWVLEDDVDGDLRKYRDARRAELNKWHVSKLAEALRAQWYLDIWGTKQPLHNLKKDDVLLERVEAVLRSPSDPRKHWRLLQAKCDSPFFNFTENQKRQIQEAGLDTLVGNFGHLFCTYNPKQIAKFIAGLDSSFRSKFSDILIDAFANRALAVDIESNGEDVFQLGIAGSDGEQLLFNAAEPNDDFTNAAKELKALSQDRWLVGHNILAWDIPVLRKKIGVDRLQNTIWDTLIISWLLAPWQPAHALVAPPHQADKDAAEAFELFKEQLKKLPSEFIQTLSQAASSSSALIESIASMLRTIDGRTYPKAPAYLENCQQDKGGPRTVILPGWRLTECAWVPGVGYLWPRGHSSSIDYVMSPSKVEDEGAKAEQDVWIHLVRAVVGDALRNNVQVLVRMLPYWLRENSREFIRRCSVPSHAREKETVITSFSSLAAEEISPRKQKVRWNVCTYAALRNAPKEERKKCPVTLVRPDQGRLETLENVKELSCGDVERAFPSVRLQPVSRTLMRIAKTSRLQKLLPWTDIDECEYWLEYDPVYLRESSHKPWCLWRREMSPPMDETEAFDEDGRPALISPFWLDGEMGIPLTRDFVWPTSGNRAAYWEETIARFLSVAERVGNETVCVLLIEHAEEKQGLVNALTAMHLTYDERDSRALRQLEALRKRKYRFAVDVIEKGAEWLEAAMLLQCRIQLVVESVPLTHWWMCLDQEQKRDVGDQSIGELDLEHGADEKLEHHSADRDEALDSTEYNLSPDEEEDTQAIGPGKNLIIEPVLLEAMHACVQRFTRPWLSTVLKSPHFFQKPIVIDPHFAAVASQIHKLVEQLDCPYSALSDDQLRVFESLREKFGEPAREIAPADYEAYRKFLENHWKYKDFRKLQRPAIEAIIPNDNDVLVRLPTGEGKSVLFQVPALLRGDKTKRLTLVITPLRALMADQTRTLWGMGFNESVDYLSTDRDPWVLSEVYQGLIDNRIKLLFIAPERFRSARFRQALERRHANDKGLEYIVIDEAHCVSQWGFEFRPDYLYAMAEIRRCFRDPEGDSSHILMFSATVTEAVRSDLEREAGLIENSIRLKVKPDEFKHPIQDFIRIGVENVGTALYGTNLSSSRIGFIEDIIKKADTEKSAVIVFVTRRRHAEEVAALLWNREVLGKDMKIRFFHAGLPPSERLEVYEEVRDRKTQVLVCTKAFGMGMDIPHIHWCTHLAPPSYLEDYLQEVGRTGRGKRERLEAKLDRVDCTLLYDSSDFAKNHEMIQRSKITPPDLVTLWEQLQRRTQTLADSDRRICVLPTDGLGQLSGDRLRKGLFWLERAERIVIQGFLPNVLKVALRRARLEDIADADHEAARVAKCLLHLYERESTLSTGTGQKDRREVSAKARLSNGALGFLTDFLGFLFSGAEPEGQTQPTDKAQSDAGLCADRQDRAEINVGTIWQQSGLLRLDDVYSALGKLQADGAIEIDRTLKFNKGSYSQQAKVMWRWLTEVLRKLLHVTADRGEERPPEELWKDLNLDEEEIQKIRWNEQRFRSAKKRCVRAAIKLCTASSLRIRETINDEQKLVYRYSLPKERMRVVQARVKRLRSLAEKLSRKLAEQVEEATFNLPDLLRLHKDQVRLRELRATIRLLENLGLYSTDQPLVPFSYILEMKMNTALSDQTSENVPRQDKEMFDQLDEVNQMAEYRAYAMELFALLPDASRRTSFIDEYFDIEGVDGLRRLLEKTVGSVEEQYLGEENALASLLQKVRQEAIEQKLKELSEEQRDACRFPYNQNLLVNAGPGAGKTWVLMMRAAHLINKQGLRPHEILILAFNRAVVHEIRDRIRGLFDTLGYGAYVSRLKVYTFHSFALMNMARTDNYEERADDEYLKHVIHDFADRCRNDKALCRRITEGIKAILVDEFQDMNEDFYSLLLSLRDACSAGIMAIGDDDQDILLWNRLAWEDEWKMPSRKEAVKYFTDFENQLNPTMMTLTTNYRSHAHIVERSQKMITRLLSGIGERRKTRVKLKSNTDDSGSFEQIHEKNLLTRVAEIIKKAVQNGETVAVLCRTNSEVYQTYESLRIDIPDIRVQTSESMRLSRLRHIGVWLDTCKRYIMDNENILLNDVLDKRSLFECIWEGYAKSGIPEARKAAEGSDQKFLWSTTLRETPSATLQDHIDFIEDLNTDDFERITGRAEGKKPRPIVSTIHKVKGLEFDMVILVGSNAHFPFTKCDASIKVLCAEETRIYYVAMTRAKKKLYFQWGDRENHWGKLHKQYKPPEEDNARYLTGSPKEVFLSWPGFTLQRKRGLQEYIKSRVVIGDRLTPTSNGSKLCHGDTTIVCLRQDIKASGNNQLGVHAVYRQPVEQNTPADVWWPKIDQEYKDQGWLYSVLVSGIL